VYNREKRVFFALRSFGVSSYLKATNRRESKMRCSQCSNNAFYRIDNGSGGETSLCLQCLSIWEGIQFREWLKSSAMMNYASASMDNMLGGLGGQSPRIPVETIARAASMANTYNNINISNSNVGAVNTGNLARIDAAITMSKGTEAEEFGARLKDLTQAILADTKVSVETKQELVEVAQAISDQAIGSKRPSKIVVATLFGRLQELAGNVTMIAGAVEKLHEAWTYLQSTF